MLPETIDRQRMRTSIRLMLDHISHAENSKCILIVARPDAGPARHAYAIDRYR